MSTFKPHGLHINKSNVILWKLFLERLTTFLKFTEVYLDSYVLDFFCKDHWKKLPKNWGKYLERFQPLDVSIFIEKGLIQNSNEVPPLSLLAYRAACSSFSLPRTPFSSIEPFKKFLNHKNNRLLCKKLSSDFCTQNSLIFEQEWKEAKEELSCEGGQHYILEHVFRKHLKPKKQHEVVRLSQLASHLVQVTDTQVLVDVGSGQGHLSRLLSYGFNVPCVCLDIEESFIQGARKFDLQLEDSLKKQRKRDSMIKERISPRHATCHLHSDIHPEKINEMLKNAWPELCCTPGHDNISFGLVGLHCCGDLGPTLLKLFTSNDACSALISVGCCYMKLSTESEQSDSPGYPLSVFVKNLKNYNISYIAREMSCHALESYSKKLRSGAESLKVHCYRAILEELIVKKATSAFAHSGLHSVKNAHLMKFHEYASAAISRIEGVHFTKEELVSDDIDRKLDKWMLVVVFYSIRLMLAPAVETLILLDRVLYLYEKGHECLLAPIFDPVLSPRNYVLVAKKNGFNLST